MPVVSIDTFSACSLMVLIVLAAMTSASKVLYPYLNNPQDDSAAERFRELSKHMLLSSGTPSNWGQDVSAPLTGLGLAEDNQNRPYSLDIDKVTRLNAENEYSINYAQLFSALNIPDASFRIEIEPLFDVVINLTATYEEPNGTAYEFEVLAEEHGAIVETELKYYVISEGGLESGQASTSDGRAVVNVTLSDAQSGPALLAVLAKCTANSAITSFSFYPFERKSSKPMPHGSFLKLSPLNRTLLAFLNYPELNLSHSYALTFDYNFTLVKTASDNDSASFSIPHILDPTLVLLVVTGYNFTTFFAECTAYPQLPCRIGASFDSATDRVETSVYVYTVAIRSALYRCSVWIGGLSE